MADTTLERARSLCLALPETTERLSHGSPTWFVKKSFASWADNHHGDGRIALWVAAPEGAQRILVEANPEQFFLPAYVAYLGWVGVRLDRSPDWEEVADIIEDAYCTVAPKRLVALLDD